MPEWQLNGEDIAVIHEALDHFMDLYHDDVGQQERRVFRRIIQGIKEKITDKGSALDRVDMFVLYASLKLFRDDVSNASKVIGPDEGMSDVLRIIRRDMRKIHDAFADYGIDVDAEYEINGAVP